MPAGEENPVKLFLPNDKFQAIPLRLALIKFLEYVDLQVANHWLRNLHIK